MLLDSPTDVFAPMPRANNSSACDRQRFISGHWRGSRHRSVVIIFDRELIATSKECDECVLQRRKSAVSWCITPKDEPPPDVTKCRERRVTLAPGLFSRPGRAFINSSGMGAGAS